MPYVDLHSGDDYASIYYTTTTMFNNVGGFDPKKSTIMILHPMLLDSTWLENQFGDPRLYLNYNLIAFDSRSCGQSTSELTGKRDSWVDAADIALCHQILNLPPCHVFALEATAVNCALRFAILFPEMCLSLALCNMGPPEDYTWACPSTLVDFLRGWGFPDDLESLEHSGSEAVSLFFGHDCDPALRDEIVSYWQKSLPPSRRPWLVQNACQIINRASLTQQMYDEITQPVLIIHGERNEVCPKRYAEALAAQLNNVPDGAVLYTVKGGGTFMSVVPGSASITNQVLSKFLSRLPLTRSDIVPPAMTVEERMQTALKQLSYLVDDKKIDGLDPTSPLSFCCLPKEAIKRQADYIEEFRKGRLQAFNPLGPDGRPIRKLSDTKSEHWFQGGKDGLSIASTMPHFPHERRSDDRQTRPEREDKLIKPRAALTPSDKAHIKAPMAKIVKDPPALSRVLL